MAEPQPLFELTRGSVTESTHYGHIAIVDSNGNLLHSQGDPHTVAFLRSSAKPFQTLPFVEQGGVEHFHYTAAELALSCASHETSQLHLDTVQGMQLKVGIHESDLQCGPHLPSDAHKLREVIKHDLQPTSNFNNCSGKHTTMLAFAKMRGLPLENYLDPSHPIQREILKAFSEMCSIESRRSSSAQMAAPRRISPCRCSTRHLAWRVCVTRGLSEARATACKKITSAMTAHSEMVSNFGEFDCELMKVGEGRIVTKRGAEGFQIVGILPGVVSDLGIGIAFKVTDGDASRMNDELERSARVRPAVTLEILKQLGALNEAQLKTLAKFGPQKILKNYAGIVTGESRTTFTL
jgi:L-asparaginase II